MKKSLFQESAQSYISKGLNCVYAHRVHKFPAGKDWKHLQTTPATVEELMSMVDDVPEDDINIAIITGKVSGIIVVDIDDASGYDELKNHGVDLPDTLTVETGRGFHHYYKYTDKFNLKTVAGVLNKVDIRADGGIVVAPPSIHATGRTYTFQNEGTEIADFPDILGVLLEELSTKKKSSDSVEKNKLGRGETIGDRLKVGNRDAMLTSTAGKLRMIGLNEESIRMALLNENRNSINPLSDGQVYKIVKSVMSYPLSAPAFELTDLGNAQRFQEFVEDKIRFNRDSGNWIAFDGKHWTEKGTDALVLEKFAGRMNLIPQELDIDDFETEEEAAKILEAYTKFSKQSRNKGKIDAALELASRNMLTYEADYDNHQFLFNAANCVVDLKTGSAMAHHFSYNMKKISNINYNPNAQCPRWIQFLDEIFLGNTTLINWLQRAIGYSITGSTKEEVFFLLYGSGSNGKSKFIETIERILGDYSESAEFSSFTTKQNDGGANNDIASLAGSRLVLASEANKGKRLNEALIKKITGDKSIKARHLYKDYFTYPVTFKIWMATNYLPNIHDDTDGTWRRIKIVPFNAQFKGENADRDLSEKLEAEAEGILNWCVDGAKMWIENGLGDCSDVEMFTEEYRDDLDAFQEFLDEYTEEVAHAKIKASDLYAIYKSWAEAKGMYVERKSDFKAAMLRRGYTPIKSSTTYYKGVGLRANYRHLSSELSSSQAEV